MLIKPSVGTPLQYTRVQIVMSRPLDLHNVTCQSHLRKRERMNE